MSIGDEQVRGQVIASVDPSAPERVVARAHPATAAHDDVAAIAAHSERAVEHRHLAPSLEEPPPESLPEPQRRGLQRQVPASATRCRLRRYAEEGSRRDEHPLITFRDGPVGRRAAVVGGPDVWEIVMWLDDLSGEEDPAAVLAGEQGVARPLIDAALRYRDAYPAEIQARIALHRYETAAADAG